MYGAGIAHNLAEAKEYQENRERYKNEIKSRGEKVSNRTKSLESRSNVWGALEGLSGLLAFTSPFSAVPVVFGVQKALEIAGYERIGTDREAMVGIVYAFGSMIAWATGNILRTYYQAKHLEELKEQAFYGKARYRDRK